MCTKLGNQADLFLTFEKELAQQTQRMERLLPWFEPVATLRLATSNAGKLFALSGAMRNPYNERTLGTVSKSGYADLLLVDGSPLEDLKAVTNTDNLKIIMKDGVIYKNTLN